LALDRRQNQLVARRAHACEGTKSKELFEYPTRGVPVGRVAVIENTHGRRAETMRWPDHGEKPAYKTTLLRDGTEAKRAAELWPREMEGKSGSGTWTWWTDELRMDDEKVAAAKVCLKRDGWTVFRSYLRTL
jgi:hypothetical protein